MASLGALGSCRNFSDHHLGEITPTCRETTNKGTRIAISNELLNPNASVVTGHQSDLQGGWPWRSDHRPQVRCCHGANTISSNDQARQARLTIIVHQPEVGT